MTPHFAAMAASGFQRVSLLARSGGSGGADMPVRIGWSWDADARSFKPDRFMGQVCAEGGLIGATWVHGQHGSMGNMGPWAAWGGLGPHSDFEVRGPGASVAWV